MTEEIDNLVTSIKLNQVLIALLEEHGSLTVPTSKFMDSVYDERELIIDYNDDEENPSFTFSLRDKIDN
jgi:hypothetical protein